MKPSAALNRHREEVRRLAMAHRTRNPRVFGSVMKGQDREGSDLDLLVEPTAETTLLDIAALRLQLRAMLGVPVDVLTPAALPDHLRAAILGSAEPV
jgi:uncharacterized protein